MDTVRIVLVQKVLGRCGLRFWLAAARWRRLRRAQLQEANSRLQTAILRRFFTLWLEGCHEMQYVDHRCCSTSLTMPNAE